MSAALAIFHEPPAAGLRMSENVKGPLLSACRHLLRPLVRILLRHGVGFGEFADAVRASFIDVARAEHVPAGRTDTDARLAMLTGIHVRDVRRVRNTRFSDDESVELNQIHRVLQGWCQNPVYLGPYGVPLEIPFQAEGKSFSKLVHESTDGEAEPELVLEELLRVGAAKVTADRYVRLMSRTYLPAPLDRLGLERLGNVVHYFIDTVDFNLQKKKQGAGRFERYAITHEGLSPEHFAALDVLVREKGQEFLEILDNWMGKHEIIGGHLLAPDEAIRTGIGVFHFIEKAGDSESDDFPSIIDDTSESTKK
jgi:hypothetical protein